MAKIAVIFLLFALFAIAMGVRQNREDPKETNQVSDLFQKFVDDVNKFVKENFNAEKVAEVQKQLEETNKKVLDAVKKASDTVNQNIQKAQA